VGRKLRRASALCRLRPYDDIDLHQLDLDKLRLDHVGFYDVRKHDFGLDNFGKHDFRFDNFGIDHVWLDDERDDNRGHHDNWRRHVFLRSDLGFNRFDHKWQLDHIRIDHIRIDVVWRHHFGSDHERLHQRRLNDRRLYVQWQHVHQRRQQWIDRWHRSP